MTTIAIFGGTGYAGGRIRDEALARGHVVISVSRKDAGSPDEPDLIRKTGNIHDVALLDQVAAQADVIVVAVRAGAQDGVRLVDAVQSLADSATTHSTRLGFVGGAGSLRITPDGPRIVDLPDFPDAHKGEALGQADMLTALTETPAEVDWFYISPAADFGGYNPGEATAHYRVGEGDVVLQDATGTSYISGADFAKAFVDEIENPKHHRVRFTVAY
jgi:putative NADH-flavin reductase